jgi:ribonuclease HII
MAGSLTWEKENALRPPGATQVAGIDEAGRGCLAGRVYAAAAILPAGFSHRHLRDSKLLNAPQRYELAEHLKTHVEVKWAVAYAEVGEIDKLNILHAALLAMTRAVQALATSPHHCLVDGNKLPKNLPSATAVVDGDAFCPSIAAASILAKTTRDHYMQEQCKQYPLYGFAKHKGYGTKDHLSALTLHGPCPLHRTSFRPVRLATRPSELF